VSRVADYLRIGIFTYSTQPRGGIVHALSIADALYDRGHDVTLHAIDDGATSFIGYPRCRLVLVPVERRSESTLEFVRRRAAAYVHAIEGRYARSFDLCHSQDGISGNALATLTERGAIPGYVRTVHHIDDFADPELAALQDRAIRSARACFTVSEVWRQHLRERFGIEGFVVPNGVDLNRFFSVSDSRRAAIRRRLGFGNDPVYVTVGGIERRKNTRAALEAFALVRARQPSARLAILGGSSVFDHSAYRIDFECRARELGLVMGRDVIVAGVLPDREVVAYLQAATALVFPSVMEGFGLVVLEAIACGTPVVTSAIPPFTEYLSSDSALLVDPHDPADIAEAMVASGEPALRRRLHENGLPVVERFSWKASALTHVALYRQLFESGRLVHA
jgi:glycosyltransferase-like protein